MTPLSELLDVLADHDAACTVLVDTTLRSDFGMILFSEVMPAYPEANRAIRVRARPGCADEAARWVVEQFRVRRRPVIADIDPIARTSGVEAALLTMGLRGAAIPRALMTCTRPIEAARQGFAVAEVPALCTQPECDWVRVQCADLDGDPEPAVWEAVARAEAASPVHRRLVATDAGVPISACQIAMLGKWARIDSVATVPAHRRRGGAAALMSHAVADCLMHGAQPYLFCDAGSGAEHLYRSVGFETAGIDIVRRYYGSC